MDRPSSSDDEPGTADDRTPVLDEVFGVLAHPMRREIIRFCADRANEPTDLDAVVDHLTEQRLDDEPPDRDRIALRLHHLHLPKLADTGLVDFDPESGQLVYRTNDVIEACLTELQR